MKGLLIGLVFLFSFSAVAFAEMDESGFEEQCRKNAMEHEIPASEMEDYVDSCVQEMMDQGQQDAEPAQGPEQG
ncbi:MAG: hypothetical protein RRB13_10125 [bacterium]|nr:hypothetical protein [bacterium]